MCNLNDSIQLTNLTANGGWNSSNNSVANIFILPNTNNKLVIVKAKAAGIATITYNIVSSNGCNAATSAIITVAPMASPTPITGATTMCKGTTTTLNNATSGGVWTSLNNAVSINANTGVTTATNPGNASIKYTVTNASGCSSFAAYTVTVNSIPNVPTIQYAAGTIDPQNGAPNGGFCVGKTFTVIGSPANGTWSATGSLSVSYAGVISINTTGAGNLTYTYTSPFGCVNSRTVSGVGYNCAAHRATNNMEPLTINSDFKMYPNPAKTFVTIDCKGAKQLLITDYFGRTIQLLNNPTEHQTINTHHFVSGFYLVTLINDNNKQTQKLVIE